MVRLLIYLYNRNYKYEVVIEKYTIFYFSILKKVYGYKNKRSNLN